MNHKCVKCGKIYARAAEEILNGCSCGSKLFYFVKNNSKKHSQEIEYFYELENQNSDGSCEIVAFDIEAINVVSSGKYEVNIESLMNNNGLIYKYGDGKYGIDLNSNMNESKKSSRRKK
ncbi:MAG: Zn-ribbon domain-containing protein [Candidatus Woesearchaeota archaeon]